MLIGALVDPALAERIKAAAARADRTVSSLIRRAVQRELERTESQAA